MLTDGEVGNINEIISFTHEYNDFAKIHTFGIGSGCDRRLIEGVARAGRGSCSLVRDATEDLNGLVIRAL